MSGTDFVSTQSILTVGAAAAAVTAVTNTLRRVFGTSALKTAFIASLGLAYLRVAISTPSNLAEWALGFVNGCILFCTAIGLNGSAGPMERAATKSKKGFAPTADSTSVGIRPFFASWF